jgi:glycosyltransferase involved in cell wall biosynthesis
MSKNKHPKLTIGLPVYNGVDFLEESIESILTQTYKDFELIISDNASTDRTEEICRDYAAMDHRIKYIRQRENMGAARNFNLVFELSTGEYFKWSAHDDVCEPDFLLECVDVLDRNPTVVAAFTEAKRINEDGQPFADISFGKEICFPDPHLRLRIALTQWFFPLPLWGLIRANVLRKTHLYRDFTSGDRLLLAELCLHGPLYQITKRLYRERVHDNSGRQTWKDPKESAKWWGTRQIWKNELQYWLLLLGYSWAITGVDGNWNERVKCYKEVYDWLKIHRSDLLKDIIIFSKKIPLLGLILSTIHEYGTWNKPINKMRKELMSITTQDENMILVDEGILNDEIPGRKVTPFIEQDGQYWGIPQDDNQAIRELERLRSSGASFIVFLWFTFWWLDYFKGFEEYLDSNFKCIFRNDRAIVYDLRN